MSHDDTLTCLSAVQMVEHVRRRELSCRELVLAHLSRIERFNPGINAVCTLLADQALAAADDADQALARGRAVRPLEGLPIALKDLTATQGVRTTRGSRLFANHVPTADALIVQRMRMAGGIIIGKTNTPEFGHKGDTDNVLFGPTRNPWRPTHSAGGSSGGSAAALAAGMVPLAEGSDGAGSIRIPASLCGIFGFKPSFGRVPDVAGAFSSHTPFFHNGPMARSVRDAALLYDVMTGPSTAHPFSLPAEAPVLPALEHDLTGLRIAFSPDLGYFPVSREVRAQCARAVQVFEALGCHVTPLQAGFSAELEAHFRVLWLSKMAGLFGHLDASSLALLEPTVQALIECGLRLDIRDIGAANLAREHLWNQLCEIHREHDLLICPSTCIPAFALDAGPPTTIEGQASDPLIGWFLTYPFNMTGHPAASLPCGFSADGLPIGLQVVGRRLEDLRVLQAAHAFEQANPWRALAPL